MNPSDIAQRLGHKPGYQLLSYGIVGLPVFRLLVECVVQEQTKLGVVEEFVLRAITTGIDRPDQLTAFLGLPAGVVDVALADGIRDGSLTVSADSQFRLTPVGKDKFDESRLTRPKQLMVNFTYDALLRKPQYYPEATLFAPKHMRSLSIQEIRAVPDRAPDPDEIDIELVNQTVKAALKVKKGNPAQILKIGRIERRNRFFLQAVALQFRPDVGDDLHIEFAIDGRASLEHDQQFAQNSGTTKNRIFSDLTPSNPANDLHEEIDPQIAADLKDICSRAISDQENSNLVNSKKAKKSTGTKGKAVKVVWRKRRSTLKERISDKSGTTAEIKHSDRILSVLEHHPLLIKSIEEAKERLLIVSPWIRQDVVDSKFIECLSECLSRRVATYIGFGIGDKDKWKEIDSSCMSGLSKLAKQYSHFRFKRLGDTHAKVLLKDNDFLVLTSFNWLSFRGDSRRPFREELGTLIATPNKVEEFFSEYCHRFD